MAEVGPGNSVQTKEIAESMNIPLSYLEQILPVLRNGGFITSSRGPHGGHVLNRPLNKINLYDVVSSIEGKFDLLDCLTVEDPGVCSRSLSCAIQLVISELGEIMSNYLRSITLEDLKCRQASFGSSAASRQVDVEV